MKKRYWIPPVIVAIGVAVYAVSSRQGPPPLSVTVEEAQRGDITSIVTATGRIFPEVEVRISSEVSGEIVELPVRDGQQVRKGDLLVRVNPDTLEAQVLQQEAALRATHANAAEAKARLLQSELDLKRIRSLHEKGFATRDQVEESETQHEIARASYQATLSRIEQQEMSLQEARNTLAKAATYSPIDGTITTLGSELGDRVVGTGQFEGTEIMRVANLSNIEARVEVSEADIVSVKIGDKATVEIEALPDRVLEGEVTEIANSSGDQQQGSSGGGGGGGSQELITFLVKVKILSPNPEVRPGMTATAEIRTETVTDVVRIPLQAVTVRPREVVTEQIGEATGEEASRDQRRGGAGPEGGQSSGSRRRDSNLERVVFVHSDGKVLLRRVKTGLADNRFIEIASGVEAGERVITGGYRILTRELAHEMAVSIAEPPRRAPR